MLNIEIKILSVNELNDFRIIRLSALEKSPKMFGSTHIAEVAKPSIFFENCLSSSTVFGAYHKNKIIGLATFTQETGIKFSHKAYLSSVFIEPEFQEKGVQVNYLGQLWSIVKNMWNKFYLLLLMIISLRLISIKILVFKRME